MSAKHLVFVCTGNSCRSVMAEGLMRQMLQRAGIDTVTIESAGIFAVGGMQPTRETLRVLQEIGIDASAHRARMLLSGAVEAADLIFVMEQFQLEEVVRRFPSAKDRVHLLKLYGLSSPGAEVQPNISDPIGKPLEVYEVCFSDIREAVDRVARSLGVHTV